MWLHCDAFGALCKCGIDGTVVGCGLTASREGRRRCLYLGDDSDGGGCTLELVTGRGGSGGQRRRVAIYVEQ